MDSDKKAEADVAQYHKDLASIVLAVTKLMQIGKLPEPEAYRYIEDTVALDPRHSIGDVARAIIAGYAGSSYPAGWGSPQGPGQYYGA